jgi:acyl-CoA synthetase (AMP-forming)/AMP-acid ligase II
MPRLNVLAEYVPQYAERRRQIEQRALPKNIGALLDAAADEAGEEIVLHCFEDEKPITYRSLREQVNRLANGMRSIGIKRRTHVGVMMPNISAMPITWLALARLGAVMIPINTAYTSRELKYVIEDSDADYLFVHQDSYEVWTKMIDRPTSIPDRHIFVVGPDTDKQQNWASLSDGQDCGWTSSEDVIADDLMNVQYTSGTTGFPKGCELWSKVVFG